jgi:hypothetical protein
MVHCTDRARRRTTDVAAPIRRQARPQTIGSLRRSRAALEKVQGLVADGDLGPDRRTAVGRTTVGAGHGEPLYQRFELGD